MSKFWKLWIDVWCVGIMVFGLILAAAGFEGFEGGARMLLNELNLQHQPVFNPVERFAIGVMGAVTLGWGLTLFIFSVPHMPAISAIKCIENCLSSSSYGICSTAISHIAPVMV